MPVIKKRSGKESDGWQRTDVTLVAVQSIRINFGRKTEGGNGGKRVDSTESDGIPEKCGNNR